MDRAPLASMASDPDNKFNNIEEIGEERGSFSFDVNSMHGGTLIGIHVHNAIHNID